MPDKQNKEPSRYNIPLRGKRTPRKKTKIWYGAIVAGLAALLFCAFVFRIFLSVRDYVDYQKGLDAYSGFIAPNDADLPDPGTPDIVAPQTNSDPPAETDAVTSDDTGTAAVTAVTEAMTTAKPASAVYTFADFIDQLERLRTTYKDFYCWIKIGRTTINYPVVRGEDNDYYLNHNIYGNKLTLGAIFADYRTGDLDSARNIVIYGHRAGYSIMFHDLENYLKPDFFDKNPYIYIYTPEYTYVYQVYAAYTSSMYSGFNRVEFTGDKDFTDYINKFRDVAARLRGTAPGAGDKLLTLATCSISEQTERYVVQAVRVSATENKR